MATGMQSISKSLPNGTPDLGEPIELALTLPRTPGIEINLHLTILSKTIMLFLANTSTETGRQGTVPMGSFVYAIPNRYNANEPLTTTLYHATSSIDFATRMARLLARKCGVPCYVGNSINLSTTLGGGSVEEEMEAFRTVVDAVMHEFDSKHAGHK